MSIEPINHYSLTNPASVYDEEALTALELAARTAGKVNEVIGDNNNFKTEQEQKTAAFVQQMKDENTNFTAQLNVKIAEMEALIREKMAFRYVYDYTNAAGVHPETTIPPIYDNGSVITIAQGVYHCPTGYTTVSADKSIPHPAINSPAMYYLVRAGLGENDVFSLKLESQIISTDVIFCGAYFHTSANVTLHNENLFLRYDERIERRDDLNDVKKGIFYDGFVHSGKISINTKSKTISVEEALTVTAPRFSGVLTVPVEYGVSYTLPDGGIGSFMFSVPYSTNTPSNLRFGLVSAITANGVSNIYLGAFGNGKLIGNHFADTVKIKIDGVEMFAGDLKNDASFVPAAVSDLLSDIGAETTDIVCSERVCLVPDPNESLGFMYLTLDNFSKHKDNTRFVIDSVNPDLFNKDTHGFYPVPQDDSTEQVTITRTNNVGKEVEGKQTFWSYTPWTHNNSGVQRNIMIVGDDLVDNNNVMQAVADIFADFSDAGSISLKGTRGIGTNRHEGRTGWSWYNYVNSDSYAGLSNPFRKNGKLDLHNYAVINNIFNLDYVFFCLGLNDINFGRPWTLPDTLDAKIERAIASANTLIDAFYNAREGDATHQWEGFGIKKFFIILPTCGRKELYNLGANPDNIHYAIQRLNERYIAEFDGNTNSDVSIIPWNIFSSDDAFDDAVRPNGIGAKKLAQLIAGAINYDEANNPIYTS